ncbi:hypothetical protein D3C87_2074390 [compost metagenome]
MASMVPLASTLSSRLARLTSATAKVGGGGAEKNMARKPHTPKRMTTAMIA